MPDPPTKPPTNHDSFQTEASRLDANLSLADNLEKISLERSTGSQQNKKDDLPPTLHPAMPLPGKPKATPIASAGTRAWDITEKFTKATAALQTGQLVKDEFFTLFESVGALEIMDPKMDSGLLQPGESLDIEYDILKELLPQEVIGIMDQLLCYEMAWHQGYPLSQTIFISVHIDKLLWPESRSLDEVQFNRADSRSGHLNANSILRSYCLGLIKSCDLTIKNITSKDYFEEEDFCTHTYNRQLLSYASDHAILENLVQTCEWLQSEDSLGGNSLNPELRHALQVRLKFRELMLLAMSSSLQATILANDWSNVIEMLAHIRDTHHLGQTVSGAFSSKLQRRLTSTAPPRPIVELSFEDAFQAFNELCRNCQEAYRCAELPDLGPQSLLQYISVFNSTKPQPLAYPRACLASIIFNNSDEAFEDLLRKDLEALVFREDSVLDPVNWTIESPMRSVHSPDSRGMQAALVDEFTSRSLPAYLEMWTTLCQNRCRIRRMLCHNILTFDQLQADAESLDEELHRVTTDMTVQFPFSTWIYHQKLRQMEWIVQLGFEHDVYLPDELAGMYSWLSEIAASRTKLLDDILVLVTRRYTKLVQQGDTKTAAGVAEQRAFIDSLLCEARGTELLADGLSTLYIHLHYLQLLKVPRRPFSDAALRHELRMKPFLTITLPPVPSYRDISSFTQPFGPYENPTTSSKEIYQALWDDADGKIKEAKSEFSGLKKLGARAANADAVETAWTKTVSNIILSCISAGLVVASIEEASSLPLEEVAKKYKIEIPGPESRYHDWWVVPKITKV